MLRRASRAALARHYRDSPFDAALRHGRSHLTLPAAPTGAESPFLAALRDAGVRSLLALALVHRETVGLLAIAWREPCPCVARDIKLATLVATHAAVALADARLHAHLHHELRQSDLLRQVTESISSELTSAQLLPKIIASAASLLGASAGVVTLLEDDGTSARVEAVYHLPPETVGMRIPVGLGVTGRALASGETVLLDPEHPLPDPFPLHELYVTPNWIAVPLWWQGTCRGAFSLGADPPHRFTAQDAAVLELFARHAVIAIENARLYERAQQAAALEERQRLARDLHDSVTQTLFSLQCAAQSAWDSWDRQPARAKSALEMVPHLARGASVEMRTLLFELHEGALGSEGVASALEKLVTTVRHRGGLPVDLHIQELGDLPRAYQEVLYRVVQEALANVVKHARATHARVTVATERTISVQVEDDGVGFGAAGSPLDSFGLMGMRERVSLLGGTLQMGNRPEGGAYVHAALPLPEERS